MCGSLTLILNKMIILFELERLRMEDKNKKYKKFIKHVDKDKKYVYNKIKLKGRRRITWRYLG